MEESTSPLVTGDDFGLVSFLLLLLLLSLPLWLGFDRMAICIEGEKMLMQCIQSQNVESSEVFTSGACTVFYGKEIFKCHSINYLFARCLDVRLVFGPDSFEESGVLHFAPPPRSSPLVEVLCFVERKTYILRCSTRVDSSGRRRTALKQAKKHPTLPIVMELGRVQCTLVVALLMESFSLKSRNRLSTNFYLFFFTARK